MHTEARLVARGRVVRHGRAPHLAARLGSEAAGEAAVRDVAQSGACAGRYCGAGLHDVGRLSNRCSPTDRQTFEHVGGGRARKPQVSK